MDAKEFNAAARRIELLTRRICATESERDDMRQEVERIKSALKAEASERDALKAERDDLRKIVEMVHTDLGIKPGDHIGEAIGELRREASNATVRQRMTESRALNYSLQAEEARREIERLRSEVESLRAKLNAKTVEWPEWAKEGTLVRVRSTKCRVTDGSEFVVGEEFRIAAVDPYDWTVRGAVLWAHVSDLEPVAEHVAPPVVTEPPIALDDQGFCLCCDSVVTEPPIATQTRPEETAPVLPRVGDMVRLVKRPEMYGENRWSDVWGIVGQEGKMTENVHHIFLNEPYILVSTQGKGESVHRLREWPVSCVEVVK